MPGTAGKSDAGVDGVDVANSSVENVLVSLPPVNVNLSVPQSPTGSENSMSSPTARMCRFFATGTCRNGSQCRFSHALNSPMTFSMPSPAPPPILIQLPAGHPVYSIDVECVATGVQHNARSIAQVALVDEWGRAVFSVYVKQDIPVLSYITELTGLTEETLQQHGLPLGEK